MSRIKMDFRVVEASFRMWKYDYQKSLRFGQFFYNRFVEDGKPWPELFYSEDPEEAKTIIYNEIANSI